MANQGIATFVDATILSSGCKESLDCLGTHLPQEAGVSCRARVLEIGLFLRFDDERGIVGIPNVPKSPKHKAFQPPTKIGKRAAGIFPKPQIVGVAALRGLAAPH